MYIKGFKPPTVDMMENKTHLFPLVDKLKSKEDSLSAMPPQEKPADEHFAREGQSQK